VRVIGIDPGTLVAGYGVVDCVGFRMRPVCFGAVRVRRDMTHPERLAFIHEGLLKVIREHRPGEAAIERLFVGKSVKSAMVTGEGRGIAVLSAALERLPVFEYTPAEVKKAVVGVGAAHKTQVQQMVRIILGMEEVPRPQDAADALAVAICHCQRLRL
jgi:crossover junction endodeoxyribonuclease RuvC